MYFPLNENVSPVCAGLPAKPFHTHSYLIFTLALRGCRADYPHFIERETQAQREVTCPRSQSYEVPEWTCQHSSTSSSYLSAARAEASLVLGEGRSPHGRSLPELCSVHQQEVMGDDVQTWSQHLPLKHKPATRKASSVTIS